MNDPTNRPRGARWAMAWLVVTLLATASGCDADEVEGLRERIRFQTAGYVSSVAFSPDGKTLVVGNRRGRTQRFWRGEVTIWDVTASNCRAVLPQEQWVNSVSISPDGKTLAVACGIFNYMAQPGIPDASGYKELPGKVKLYDMATLQERDSLTCAQGVFGVAFSPDGRWLASLMGADRSRPGEVVLWDTATWKKRQSFPHQGDTVIESASSAASLAFSPDSRILATAEMSRRSGDPGNVALHDLGAGTSRELKCQNSGAVVNVAFRGNGKLLAVCVPSLRLWNVESGEEEILKPLAMTGLSAVFSPKGETLAVGGRYPHPNLDNYRDFGALDVLRVSDQTKLAGFRLADRNTLIEAVAYSPDGKSLATGDMSGRVTLWDFVKP